MWLLANGLQQPSDVRMVPAAVRTPLRGALAAELDRFGIRSTEII